MTTLTPTERAVIRHLSLSEPMTFEQAEAVTGLTGFDLNRALTGLAVKDLSRRVPIRHQGRFTGRHGDILTPAGADLCEAMEQERRYEEQQQTRRLGDTSDLHAIAAQATREHGEPDGAMSVWTDTPDGDALIAQAMQSPRFFSPPRKPSLWARVKAAFRRAA